MALSTAAAALPTATPAAAGVAAAAAREPRLDLFRGLAMLIIMVAHIRDNPWAQWIPARFGPSDAAEMFVLCSGYAAALAFGATFERRGLGLGTARILFRCAQIYAAHLGLFLAVATIAAAADLGLNDPGRSYIDLLNLRFFFDQPARALVGLATLTYVPNYFDILPMYMIVLLMMPLVVVLQRLDTRLALTFCVLVYLAAGAGRLALPAEPWSDRPWLFNPFAWQLLFFTGFAFGRGWLRMPPFRPWLVGLALAWVLLWIPVAHWAIHPRFEFLTALNRAVLDPVAHKTDEHIVRYLHILALAYLALWLLRGRGDLLTSPWVRPVIRVGQQALSTFLASMTLAWILTILVDRAGNSGPAFFLANVAGLAAMVAVAYLVAWIKRAPWRGARPPSAST